LLFERSTARRWPDEAMELGIGPEKAFPARLSF